MAYGISSDKETCIEPFSPAKSRRRFKALPVKINSGLPSGRETISISVHEMPRIPDPKAFEHASLAANLAAYDDIRFLAGFALQYACSPSVKMRLANAFPKRSKAFSMRRISVKSVPNPTIIVNPANDEPS